MFKSLVALTTLMGILISTTLLAECCQSAEVAIGWRRDDLEWKTRHLDSSYIPGHANSRIHFKDIDLYTISGKVKWVDSEYYIRLSGEYGLSNKGRAHELFQIKSPWLYHPLEVKTNDRIKRESEVYDLDAAVGYPFTFLNCRLSVIPLIGFSFHRQHLRVKAEEEESYYSSSSASNYSDLSYSEFFSYHSSSSFYVDYSNPFIHSTSSDPFSSRSDPNIAHSLGLKNPHHTSTYRFTWYGFYLGADIAYALDSCWTLFTELEGHFLNNCHRKRKSWTGVYFVDDYHEKGWAYGFNTVVGLTYYIANCWYSTLAVDFKWWKAHSHSKHDELHWQSVGVKIGVGYMF